MLLRNKVAMVTGGAQGIGRAIVERFSEADVSAVVIVDINEPLAQNTAQDIMDNFGGQILALHADVSDSSQVQKVVSTTLEKFGRIDILVNNAGICPVTPWDEITLDSWNRVLSVNLTSAFLFTHAVVPSMKLNHFGRIVFISSESAFSGSVISHVAYGVSKAGMLNFMRSVAKKFAQDGILANAVSPGPVDTPMGHNLGDDFWVSAEQRTLLKRHATGCEIADAVLFFASDQSTFITGQYLRVNGGRDLMV